MIQETAQAATQVAQTGVLGTLGLDLNKFVGQLVDFGIVLFVMWRWVYKPLLKMMDKRTKEIEKGLSDAKLAKEQVEHAKTATENILQAARVEAHKLIEETRAQAESLKKDKMTQTRTEIEKIAAEAKQQIRMEREASFDALKADIAVLIATATQKVAEGMDEKQQRQLIDKAIKEIGKA
jgi:F-type H+-transporting ATPase subunit b